MKNSKTITEIDITIEGEDKYCTYVYHKDCKEVHKYIHNGFMCIAELRKRFDIPNGMRTTPTLPKYIIKTLNV